MNELVIRNRQRTHSIHVRFLTEIGRHALEKLLQVQTYSCAGQIVSPAKMAQVNWDFLQHEGSTDVITFDYREYPEQEQLDLAGEIFICYEDAIKQAAEFKTSAEHELVRYLVHGFLHLLGYDDLVPDKRKLMKREENRLMKGLEKSFDLPALTRR